MSIEKMLQQYKNEAELREFAEAQHVTLTELMKKNKQLQEEVNHLKTLVTGAMPIVAGPEVSVASDEEEIAKIEIRKLKERSFGNVLTLEEAKRLEIYTKILSSKQKKDKPDEREVKEVDENILLAIAESPNNESSAKN